MHEMLQLAAKIACKRKDRRIFYVGAIGFRADGTLVHARNEATELPNPDIHAEARLVRKLGKWAPIVYVARYSFGNQALAMAKPCEYCMNILRAYKVREVIFSTGPDSFQRMEIR